MIVKSVDDAARELAAMLRQTGQTAHVARRYATVTSVSYPTCSIRYDGEVGSDAAHAGVAMTTSCRSMVNGDRVIVDIVDHRATVTGVIAR